MLSCQNLCLKINNRIIFQNINFTALQSAILYIKGNNGAGKTSLLQIIAGIKNPSYGKVIYNNYSIKLYKKPYCNYIGHQIALKPDLYVKDYLKYWTKISEVENSLYTVITHLNLSNFMELKCHNLSIGQQKRVVLARLMLCRTKIWILDEVETNLDDQTKLLLYQLIVSKANCGGIILISSHTNPKISSAQIIDLKDYYE